MPAEGSATFDAPSEPKNSEDMTVSEEFAEAHKLNKGLKEGMTTAEELEQAGEQKLRDIGEKVDRQFIQKLHKPEKFWERRYGHEAEEKALMLLMKYFKHTGDIFYIRKARMYEDQGVKKMDVAIGISGHDVEIPVQLTTAREGEIVKHKLGKLPPETLFMVIPHSVDTMIEVIERGNNKTLEKAAHPLMLQLLEGLRSKPQYQQVYDEILPRLKAT